MKRISAITIMLIGSLIAFSALLFSPVKDVALAQTGSACDSSVEVRSCTATVQIEGNWANITSSDSECSRVDWYSGPQPQTTIVRGGFERVELLGGAPNSVEVSQCVVIRDLAQRTPDAPETIPVRCGYTSANGDMTYTTLSIQARSREEAASIAQERCRAMDSGMERVTCRFSLPNGQIIERTTVAPRITSASQHEATCRAFGSTLRQ